MVPLESDKDFNLNQGDRWSLYGDDQEMVEVADGIETADERTGCDTDFHVRETPRFNATEVRQPVDLSSVPLENIGEVPQLLRHKLTNAVNYSPSGKCGFTWTLPHQ